MSMKIEGALFMRQVVVERNGVPSVEDRPPRPA